MYILTRVANYSEEFSHTILFPALIIVLCNDKVDLAFCKGKKNQLHYTNFIGRINKVITPHDARKLFA